MKFAHATAGAFKPVIDAVKPLAAQLAATLALVAIEKTCQALYSGARAVVARHFGDVAEPHRPAGAGVHVRHPQYDADDGGYECPECGTSLDGLAATIAADQRRRGEPVHDQRPGVH